MTGIICTVSAEPIGKRIGDGRVRLTLQSVCREDTNIRCIRPVWEREDAGGVWHVTESAPEFSPRYWVEAFGKAAEAGWLGSASYKNLLVRLVHGLDATKQEQPHAYLKVTGRLTLSWDKTVPQPSEAREPRVYKALERPNREVTAAPATKDGRRSVEFVVVEELHYSRVLQKLGDDLAAVARETSLENLFQQQPEASFRALVGDPALTTAGFGDESLYKAEYEVRAV